jgi:hypothetical protein
VLLPPQALTPPVTATRRTRAVTGRRIRRLRRATWRRDPCGDHTSGSR